MGQLPFIGLLLGTSFIFVSASSCFFSCLACSRSILRLNTSEFRYSRYAAPPPIRTAQLCVSFAQCCRDFWNHYDAQRSRCPLSFFSGLAVVQPALAILSDLCYSPGKSAAHYRYSKLCSALPILLFNYRSAMFLIILAAMLSSTILLALL